jgi:predicted phosphodiesterase
MGFGPLRISEAAWFLLPFFIDRWRKISLSVPYRDKEHSNQFVMKIAVLSDIHGNVPALQTVLEDIQRWRADEIVVNGDLVSRGPYSLACLRLLKQHDPQPLFVKGNHETLVLSCSAQQQDPLDPTFELHHFAHWSTEQLGMSTIEEIRRWPDHLDLSDPQEGSVHITHGSRLGNRNGIYPETSAEELSVKLGGATDLFIASHTHRPLQRRFNGSLVVNVGSVGQPLDGDPRAAYGRFTFHRGSWRAEIARLRYDKVRAERDFIDSGFLDECGPIARLIYLELRQSCGHMSTWRRRYLHRVVAAQISVKNAVDEYLSAR